MASFKAASALGVSHVEADVRRTADGVLVMIHDETLDRTTDGHGRVDQIHSRELRELDAGAWFGAAHAGERVPTFEEFVDWIGSETAIGALVEAKARGVAGEIVDRIVRSPARQRFALCSFFVDELLAAKSAGPSVPCILLVPDHRTTGDVVADARSIGVDGFDRCLRNLSGSVVDRAHDTGLIVMGGLANDPPAVERALQLGVDFCDSDRPATALAALRVARQTSPRPG